MKILSLPSGLCLFVLSMVAAALPARAKSPGEVVSGANTDFAVDLYRQLARAPGNLFFSPFSVSTALAMTWEGARGSTAAGMAAALHLALPRDQAADGFARLDARLREAVNHSVDLVTANSLWAQSQFPFRPDYLSLLQTRFGAEAKPVDFTQHAADALTAINRWVDAKTRGRIARLLGPGSVGPSTRMVLCNAVYFKGRWKQPFRRQATRPAPFHLAPGATVSVPMMHQTASFRWNRQDGFDLLEIPYTDQLSMVILLPHAVDGLPALEHRLTGDNLRLWLAALDFSPVRRIGLYLPRFTAAEDYNLRPALTRMGMRDAFNPTAADFSGMSAQPGLYLSDVVHKAVIKVDEKGTEAAAATGTIMLYASAMPQHRLEFRVDHPFLYLIRDNLTGTILFLGRAVDPL